jgi:hypothetical protein
MPAKPMKDKVNTRFLILSLLVDTAIPFTRTRCIRNAKRKLLYSDAPHLSDEAKHSKTTVSFSNDKQAFSHQPGCDGGVYLVASLCLSEISRILSKKSKKISQLSELLNNR